MTKIHVIKDESLGGIEREYVGESEVLVAKGERHSRKVSEVTPTDIVHIDGARYRMVERKAEVGEKVFVLGNADVDVSNIHEIYTVTKFEDEWTETDGKFDDGSNLILLEEEYRVLETIADDLVTVDTTQASPEVIDLLANLASRLTTLEQSLARRVTSLEQQLKDTQANVERQAEELAEVKHLAESNEKDIALLDERTHTYTIARALAKRLEVGGVGR